MMRLTEGEERIVSDCWLLNKLIAERNGGCVVVILHAASIEQAAQHHKKESSRTGGKGKHGR